MNETGHLGSRFACLVIVPTVFASVPGFFFLNPDSGPDLSFRAVGALPLLGFLPVWGYRWLTRERVLLLPYLPGVAVSVFYLALTVDALASTMFHEPGSEFLLMALIPLLALAQPLLTMFGGTVSFVHLSGRTRPELASR